MIIRLNLNIMKLRIYAVAGILILSIAATGQNSGQTDQLILKLKNEIAGSGKSPGDNNSIGNNTIDNLIRRYQANDIKKQPTGKNSQQSLYVIKFPEGTNIQQLVNELNKTGEIEYAEPDYKGYGGGTTGITPNDQYYYRQWGLKNDGSFSFTPAIPGADIEMENAWAIEQGDSNIVVALSRIWVLCILAVEHPAQ